MRGLYAAPLPRGEGRSRGVSLALDDCHDRAGGDVLQHLGAPAGPADLEAVGLPCAPEPEVLPEVALRQVARACLDLPELSLAPGYEAYPCADAASVALFPYRPYHQRRTAIASVVAQKVGALAVVGDQQVQVAIVVDVSGRQCPADLHEREARSRAGPDVSQPSAVVAQQEVALRVAGVGAEVRGVVQDVA